MPVLSQTVLAVLTVLGARAAPETQEPAPETAPESEADAAAPGGAEAPESAEPDAGTEPPEAGSGDEPPAAEDSPSAADDEAADEDTEAAEPDGVQPDGDAPQADDGPPEEATPDLEPGRRARLRGRVLIFGEGEPATGARLIPVDGREPIETDENGRFAAFMAPGTHAFIVRGPGFDELRVEVQLAPGQDVEMEYYLDPAIDGKQYRTIVEQNREVAVSSTSLRDAEIHAVPGSGGDPVRVVNRLPGVSTLAGFLPYVIVRGAAPGNTGYFLDGTRVPILFHVAIGPSVIHPLLINSVDFYPSGAPVRLGRYTSGMIEAKTRPGRRDRVHGAAEIRLTDAGLLLEVPISRPIDKDCDKPRRECKGDARGAITMAGRYSYTALILNALQSAARIQYWDYYGKFEHDIGRRFTYQASALGSFDDLGTNDAGPDGEDETFLRFSFHRFENRLRQRLRRGGTGDYVVTFGFDQTGISRIRTNEYQLNPRVNYVVPTRLPTVTLGFGLDQQFQFFRLNDSNPSTGTFSTEDLALLFSDRFVSATGAFFDIILQKGAVEFRPGVRVDLYAQVGSSPYLPTARTVTHAFGVDPRMVVREKVGRRWTLEQTAGLYHQPPSFPIPVPGIESFGFERGLQRNLQGSFGYELEVILDKLTLSQDVYLGHLSNLQDYELGEELEDNPVTELEDVISQVTGYAYGLETMLKLDPSLRIYGWIAYTLSRATRNFTVGGTAPSNWDQRHILNLVLGYQISHKWRFGVGVHYHTGRPWTAPEEGQSAVQALGTNRNNARLPAFFQLDVRAERIWRWPKWQLSAVLDVANASYSREIFQCETGSQGVDDVPLGARSAMLTAGVNPNRGLVQCTPIGFRYIIPSLGLRAQW